MSTASQEEIVLLEWIFSPNDFFESVIEISRSEYSLDVTRGAISARLPALTFDSDPQIKARLHDSLFDRMRGIQLLTRREFTLSKPRMTRIDPDGRRHIFVELEGLTAKLATGHLDVIVTDTTGNVIRDTKQERITRKRDLGELVAKYRPGDMLLQSMLQSYSTSTSDANNELVHLYEIRESLAVTFGGQSTSCAALSITTTDWRRLGDLCNNEPLRQGRHRGKVLGGLRDATEAELGEARNIARGMIEAYLQYKESGGVVRDR